MNIIVLPREEIAVLVADHVQSLLKNKPNAVLSLTTGTTPLTTGIYEEWVRRENAEHLSFTNAVFINPDEQIGIDPSHEQSYYQYMRRHFLDQLNHQPRAWHIPIGTAENPQRECEAMETTIQDYGGIDWQLLGIGLNGHICFIEPDRSIPSVCYITEIAESNRQLYALDYGSLEAVPTQAVTFGLGTVLRARELCLVACGSHKADIVFQAITGRVTTELPASLLQLHPNVTIILDPEAAASLPQGVLHL